MKILTLWICFFSIIGCKNNNNEYTKQDYMHGWIIDESKQPVEKVVIYYMGGEVVTHTNNKGYFKIESHKSKDNFLVLEKKGYKKRYYKKS